MSKWWGRKEYFGKPSNYPVWMWAAICAGLLTFAVLLACEYKYEWSGLERYYAPIYMKTGFRAWQTADNHANYEVLYVIDNRSRQRLALPDDIETTKRPDGKTGYQLTHAALEQGWTKPAFEIETFSDDGLHAWLAHRVYQDQTAWDYAKYPMYGALAVFFFLLPFAMRKERQREHALVYGRRLRGPEMVTASAFNRHMQRKQKQSMLLDGLLFLDETQSWLSRVFGNKTSHGACIPREREARHVLLMGDTGAGKTVAIRRLLQQVEARGEVAIVYDSTKDGEYVREFYNPERGDIILNPLDKRCPYWTPCDEVLQEAEALTLAASLFPEKAPNDWYFINWAREVFAAFLLLKPTPEQLRKWLCDEAEIDRISKGNAIAAGLPARSPRQRDAVLGTLNMVSAALKLLPREDETTQRWSVAEWAKKRKGWVFITSSSSTRVALRPLISLWIDLFVLRLMDEGGAGAKTFLVLDEVANLQRLPLLQTALFESRKSNCVMVLGLQGKAQMDDTYGHIAEAMLSQPATKLFLTTSNPDAADFISRAIGEVEIERFRESRTQTQSAQGHDSISQQHDITREPLVMGSEITGLEELHGYLKHGNYVVPLRMPYVGPEMRHAAFIERTPKLPSDGPDGGGALPLSQTSSESAQQLTSESSTQHEPQFID